MYPKFEQRGCSRFENEIPIVFNNCSEIKYNRAIIYNRSSSGIYFESDIPIHPGAEIYIENNHSTRFSGLDLYHVKVVWCEEIHDAVVFYRFGMGAEYCSPDDYSKFVHPKLRVIQGGKSLR
ncbi:MAG: hypothetical protein GY797_15330 [Deltaproteobacteria bacterium]|nr:hypothetical protein [Deltaproteobacteria bacterium]